MREELGLKEGEKLNLLPFGITNALLNDFFLLDVDEALNRIRSAGENRAIKMLAAAAMKKPSVYRFGDPKEFLRPLVLPLWGWDGLPPEYAIFQEIATLSMALYSWLFPVAEMCAPRSKKYRKPSEKYAAFFAYTPPLDAEKLLNKWGEENKQILRIEALRKKLGMEEETESGMKAWSQRRYLQLQGAAVERQKHFSTTFISLEVEKRKRGRLVKGEVETYTEEWRVPARLYESDNILALAWAELLYAVENDIYARPCSICGNWFPPTKGLGQQIRCSLACRLEAKRKKEADKYRLKQNR